ncbi:MULTISPECIES: LysE family transporter [Shouchella]|uniref:LysE family transporter n=1 Tax=Shouchella TaxID=2893057 RepID=UPI002040E025|nr:MULTISPECIES: LysE family transporter [Shouchella]MCM3381225.1 LysE family transporter [Shouchella rhizosphaerae]
MHGADTILIIKNMLIHGAKTGYFTIRGMVEWPQILFLLAVFGLSLVIAQSIFLFNIIKYLGPALFDLLRTNGTLNKWWSNGTKKSVVLYKLKRINHLQGAISNIINSRTLLVYVTFMPQIINLSGNTN